MRSPSLTLCYPRLAQTFVLACFTVFLPHNAWSLSVSMKTLIEGHLPKETALTRPSVRVLERWLSLNNAGRKKFFEKECSPKGVAVESADPVLEVLCAAHEVGGPAQALLKLKAEAAAQNTVAQLQAWFLDPSTENADKLERVCAVERQDKTLQKALKGVPVLPPGLGRAEAQRPALTTFMMSWLPLVHSKPCLSIVLGQKAEELLPDEIAFHWVDELYRRAIQDSSQVTQGQSTDGDAPAEQQGASPEKPQDKLQDSRFDKARFRLTLLWLLKNKTCPREAQAWLKPLSERKEGDFILRSLYWRMVCAKEAGKEELVKELEAQLLAKYPISFHRIHSAAAPQDELKKILDQGESLFQVRSIQHPRINAWISVAEYYARKKDGRARHLAKKVLDSLDEVQAAQSLQMEPEVLIYLGWLRGISGHTIEQYKNFSQAVQEKPGILSRPFLELYFPLLKRSLIEKYAKKQGLDPLLVAALIRQESGFMPGARSGAGAMGWMQLLPATAKRFARVGKNQLLEPEINVKVGTRYLQVLMSRFQNQIPLVLAAYNAGPEVVATWERRYGGAQGILFWDLIPYRETREYVALIARNYLWYQSLYGKSVQFDSFFSTTGP